MGFVLIIGLCIGFISLLGDVLGVYSIAGMFFCLGSIFCFIGFISLQNDINKIRAFLIGYMSGMFIGLTLLDTGLIHGIG